MTDGIKEYRPTFEELDVLLSEAQLKLRNGHDDHLSRAVVEARNRLAAYAANAADGRPQELRHNRLKKAHDWQLRKGENTIYDCAVCGAWTANLPLAQRESCYGLAKPKVT